LIELFPDGGGRKVDVAAAHQCIQFFRCLLVMLLVNSGKSFISASCCLLRAQAHLDFSHVGHCCGHVCAKTGGTNHLPASKSADFLYGFSALLVSNRIKPPMVPFIP